MRWWERLVKCFTLSQVIRWEYKTSTFHDSEIEEFLSIYGHAGWELVSKGPTTSGNRGYYSLIFKRPLE